MLAIIAMHVISQNETQNYRNWGIKFLIILAGSEFGYYDFK